MIKLQKYGVRRADEEKSEMDKRMEERLTARKQRNEYLEPTGLPLANERLMQRGLHAGANPNLTNLILNVYWATIYWGARVCSLTSVRRIVTCALS